MQMPTQDNRRPVLPTSEKPRPQYGPQQPRPEEVPAGVRPGRHGRFRRFVRGYLMLVGSLTTLYVLVKLLVLLFVEIGKWMPGQPTL